MDTSTYNTGSNYFWCLHPDCLTSVEFFKSQDELDKHYEESHTEESDYDDSNTEESDYDEDYSDNNNIQPLKNNNTDTITKLTKEQIVTQSVSIALNKVSNSDCNDNIQLAKMALNEYYKNIKELNQEDKILVTLPYL
jgi:hypothetical protein